MKILLCMLSDQHIPNTLSVHHFKPERLILIVTEDMQKKNRVDHFLDAIEAGGLNYRERCDCVPLSSVSDFGVIRHCFEEAHHKHPDEEWIVNLTGGTKPMSIMAYDFFKTVDARLVYVEANRPETFLFVNSGQKESCAHKTSIKEFVHGYGFELRKSEKKITEAEKRARRWAKAAEILANEPKYSMPDQDSEESIPLRINDELRNKSRNRGIELEKELLVLPENIAGEVASIFNLHQEGGSLLGKLGKYEAEFFTGGWLEVFLWNQLDRFKEELRIWNVSLGIEIGRLGAESGNELDISFMHGHALCTIECKSGAQEQDKSFNVLYKVEAIIRQFRALHVRPFLATTSPNIYTDGNLKSNIKDRASIYNCKIVTPKQIRTLACKLNDVDLLKRVLFEKEIH